MDSDKIPAALAAFAIATLEAMERCDGRADACITLERASHWNAIRSGLAGQVAGRTFIADSVRAYIERVRAVVQFPGETEPRAV